MKSILITGGAGYVGAVLVPKMLAKGHRVRVMDLMIYGDDVFDGIKDKTNLEVIKGDIRDRDLMEKALSEMDTVIHLACISNDPSYELNPDLGKSINYDAFIQLVELSRKAGIDLFVYASSSSVYGIKDELEVTEDLSLEPLTDYSKYKALCEEVLLKEHGEDFTQVVLRPSTVCGYSPRMRLDLTVNILTNLAINKGVISVFGGEQLRPNIHIEDMANLYVYLLELPKDKIAGKIYNAGYQNYKVIEIAELVKKTLNKNVRITVTPSNDNRSYRVCSDKIRKEIGFVPQHTIEEAVAELEQAFGKGLLPNPLDDPRYFNVKMMKEINLE